MLLKKETSTIVNIELSLLEQQFFKNYSKGISDHCTLELSKDIYFVFCKVTPTGFIKYNGQLLFVGELEFAIRQEQGNYNDIVIKYCCDYSNYIGNVLSKNCLIQPIFNNNKIGYNYSNNILSCYNVA